MRAWAALTALAVLILFGMVITNNIQVRSQIPLQASVLAPILISLSALFTPLSSSLGIPTPLPPYGEEVLLGPGPFLAWLAAGISAGLLARRASTALVPTLICSSTAYLGVIALAVYVLPRIPGAMPWEVYLASLSQRIIVEGPLDFAFVFIAPALAALLSSSIAQAFTPKPRIVEQRRRRFWELDDEDGL